MVILVQIRATNRARLSGRMPPENKCECLKDVFYSVGIFRVFLKIIFGAFKKVQCVTLTHIITMISFMYINLKIRL